MINKLKYLTRMSLRKKIKTKWFAIANVVLLLVMICLVNMDSIIKFFGGDFNETTQIVIIDNTEYNIADTFKQNYEQTNSYLEDMSKVKVTSTSKDIEEIKKEVKDDDNKILLVVDKDSNNFLKAQVVINKEIDAITSQLISSTINSVKQNIALSYFDITYDKLKIIESPVDIEQIKLDKTATNDKAIDMVMGVVFPFVFLPFFMLTMFLIQMIGAEINEEKTTRGMEIIISNVSPKIHFISKLISSNVFVLLQGVILIIDSFVALVIRSLSGMGSLSKLATNIDLGEITVALNDSGVISKLGYVVPIALVLMVITFVAYSLVAGILASVTTNTEDFQQLQTPIVIISLVGFYLAIMAFMFDGSLFIRILSYVPFLSALLSPALLIMGQIGIIDVIVSLIILIGTIYLLFKYGLRIYKVGILNYSQTGLWKKMFKAVRNK